MSSDSDLRQQSSSRWVVLAIVSAAALILLMDISVLNVALPSLIDDMQPEALTQLWIVDIYGLVLGGLLVVCGSLGDRFGRKRLFLIGLAVFGIASVLAALSFQPWQLVFARALCGVGAALTMPSTLSIIRSTFTDDRERATAVAIWSAASGFGAAIGPMVGGVLVQAFGWPAAFWLNVPLAVLTIAAGWWMLPELRAATAESVDWLGALELICGIIVTTWGIKHIASGALTVSDVVALVAGIALLIVFVQRQLRLAQPLLDIRMFRIRMFTGSALTTLASQLTMGVIMLLMTLWLQYVHGYSPAQAGLRMVPIALASFAGSMLAARLVTRFGTRMVITTSLLTCATAYLLLAAWPQSTTYAVVAAAQVLLGLGVGVGLTVASAAALSSTPPDKAGQAAGVSETCYDLGQGLGVAILGSLYAAVFAHHMTDLPVSGEQLDIARGSVGGAVSVGQHTGGTTGQQVIDTATTAFDSALSATSYVSTAIVAAAAAATWWLLRPITRA
ncbi:MFS transporter [Nocardia heshunensis]